MSTCHCQHSGVSEVVSCLCRPAGVSGVSASMSGLCQYVIVSLLVSVVSAHPCQCVVCVRSVSACRACRVGAMLSVMGYCVAQYDYSASQPSQLSLTSGQRVCVSVSSVSGLCQRVVRVV